MTCWLPHYIITIINFHVSLSIEHFLTFLDLFAVIGVETNSLMKPAYKYSLSSRTSSFHFLV